MSSVLHTTNRENGLTVKAYRGDGSVLLAINLEDHLVEHLAGFAIRRTMPNGQADYLLNRLDFKSTYTAETTAQQRKWTSTLQAPFQKFWWVDFPPDDQPGEYTYEVTAMRFKRNGLEADQSVNVALDMGPFRMGNFEMGFTRGYLSSQAYHDRFQNRPLRPTPKSLDYDTSSYQDVYTWLGFHARKMIYGFLDECLKDPKVTIDVFAYDLDEPDLVKTLQRFEGRLRLLLDDADLHNTDTALEPEAFKRIAASAGADQAKRGKFGRYAHDKVIIRREDGKPTKILTGSTNFSVTGLCVNANNVLTLDDPKAAALYGQVFDLAFRTDAKLAAFANSALSKKEWELTVQGLPKSYVSFAPHEKPTSSLKRLLTELNKADSSVLFAVMGLKGKGAVLDKLRNIHADPKIFSYGVTDDPVEEGGKGGVTVYKPGKTGGILVQAAALTKNVPEPFASEATEGLAHKIHHKFVVVDFNDSDPVVFTGSSNLAEGGEENNGDNLLAIYDREIASAYAIEAIRLVDHYHFRAALKGASKTTPLRLKSDAEKWWNDYYNPKSMRFRERLLFVR